MSLNKNPNRLVYKFLFQIFINKVKQTKEGGKRTKEATKIGLPKRFFFFMPLSYKHSYKELLQRKINKQRNRTL